jgi:hypothetical protein
MPMVDHSTVPVRSLSSLSHAWSIVWYAVRRTRYPNGQVLAILPSDWYVRTAVQ